MSKVIPAEDSYEAQQICPRYEQWLLRSNQSFNINTKRKRSTTNHYIHCLSTPRGGKRKPRKGSDDEPTFTGRKVATKGRYKMNDPRNQSAPKPPMTPLQKSQRAKNLFIQIRKRSRNFRIRCQTSVELWRQWIKRGIRWDLHVHNFIDEDEQSRKGFKGFFKKNFVSEVIVEEDESGSSDVGSCATESIVEEPPAKQTENDDLLKVNTSLNLFRKSSIKSIISGKFKTTKEQKEDKEDIPKVEDQVVESEKVEQVEVVESVQVDDTQSDGTDKNDAESLKLPIKDLASMNIDKLETLPTTTTVEPVTVGDNGEASEPLKKNPIRRAFNKLMFMF